jgi:hypothetical protein
MKLTLEWDEAEFAKVVFLHELNTRHFINEGIFCSYYILDSTPVTKLFPSFDPDYCNKKTC